MPDDQPFPDVHLRPFQPQDYPRLLDAVGSPQELMQWAGPQFEFPLDHAQLEAYRLSAELQPATRRILTACLPDGQAVGHIELNEINGHSARLCRVMVDPARRGQRFGRAMVSQALRYGFEQLGLHRIELLVFDFNSTAIRVYEREGFVKEGHLREARSIGGKYWSLDLMGVLESEWRQIEDARSDAGARGTP
jgi:RimJ/RimL family protein N-acetyltransferase